MAEKPNFSSEAYPTATAFYAAPATPHKDAGQPAQALPPRAPYAMQTPTKATYVAPSSPMPMPVPMATTPMQNGAFQPQPVVSVQVPKRRRLSSLVVLTIKLFVFHWLNFILATAAFSVVLTGVCVAAGLLPLCCLGIPIFLALLFVVRWFAYVDVALSDFITPQEHRVLLHVSPSQQNPQSLVLAHDLHKVSWRSGLAIVYFVTLKFVIGIISICIASLPFSTITGHAAYYWDSDDWDSKTFNDWWNKYEDQFDWEDHPVWCTIASIAIFVIGVVLMHLFGRLSRHATRQMCCEKKEDIPMFTPQVYTSRV